MSSQDVAEALQTLNAPTSTLSILSLADPILSSSSSSSSSSTADNNEAQLTPASLVADLAHYKDLFAKLRFSYVEQVTKERFLKAIVADPPELVDAADNVELEQELKGAKAALKSKKVAMEHVVKELQDLGTRLAQTHDIITLQTTQLAALPSEIENLEAYIATLESSQAPTSSDPELNLSLAATASLLSDRQAQLADLDRQLSELQSQLPTKKREVANLESELAPLEKRKRVAIEEARAAQRRRGTGGMAAELEEKGRWLKGSDAGLRAMLEI